MKHTLLALLGTTMFLTAPLVVTAELGELPWAPTPGTTAAAGPSFVEGNLVPQELTVTPGVAPTPSGKAHPPSQQQRLISAGTYDCATGAPAVPGERYSFDVVPLVALSPFTIGGAPMGGRAFLAYGAEQPPNLYPGLLTFYAFLYCGGTLTKVLPATNIGQAPGIFGFVDETIYGRPWQPEFRFEYREHPGAGPAAFTAGWYMTSSILVSPADALQRTTFRFVVNPSLTTEYPGYSGSLFTGVNRHCLTDDTPWDNPQHGGLFGNCDNSGPLGWNEYFHPAPSHATAEKPAPALEDVDIYEPLDRGHQNLLEPTYLEAQAALGAAAALIASKTPSRIAAERELDPPENAPQSPGGGWQYYFDVQKWVGASDVVLVNADPLYEAQPEQGRAVYPGVTGFTAILGLIRDYDKDGTIDFGDAREWYPLHDRYLSSDGQFALDLADVGSLSASHFSANENVYTWDTCSGDFAYVPMGHRAPIATTKIATCNPNGDADGGWGTFPGRTNRDGRGTFYSTQAIIGAYGDQYGPMLTEVEARIRWPSSDDWSKVATNLPEGLTIAAVAGTSVILRDNDVYDAQPRVLPT